MEKIQKFEFHHIDHLLMHSQIVVMLLLLDLFQEELQPKKLICFFFK